MGVLAPEVLTGLYGILVDDLHFWSESVLLYQGCGEILLMEKVLMDDNLDILLKEQVLVLGCEDILLTAPYPLFKERQIMSTTYTAVIGEIMHGIIHYHLWLDFGFIKAWSE
jgi:hypothetical protein